MTDADSQAMAYEGDGRRKMGGLQVMMQFMLTSDNLLGILGLLVGGFAIWDNRRAQDRVRPFPLVLAP
jgi:hypothetical protein